MTAFGASSTGGGVIGAGRGIGCSPSKTRFRAGTLYASIQRRLPLQTLSSDRTIPSPIHCISVSISASNTPSGHSTFQSSCAALISYVLKHHSTTNSWIWRVNPKFKTQSGFDLFFFEFGAWRQCATVVSYFLHIFLRLFGRCSNA